MPTVVVHVMAEEFTRGSSPSAPSCSQTGCAVSSGFLPPIASAVSLDRQ
jgi:hypothetical protein